MGDRITVQELRNWLLKYDPDAQVAFLVNGNGKQGNNDNAFQVREIRERVIGCSSPTDEAAQIVVFLNLE